MIDETIQPTIDEGIRCPACEYNLTGLSEGICPECGETFDREGLLLELFSGPVGIPIWCDRSEHGAPTAFVLTLIEIWTHPVEYFAAFPRIPAPKEAIAFSRWCLLVAACLIALPSMGGAWTALVALLAGGLQLGIAASVCERLIARFVFLPASYGEHSEATHHRSLAMLRMARAFMVPSTFCFVTGMAVGMVGQSADMLPLLGVLGTTGVVVYWWVSMVRVATLRRPDALVRAIVGIPLSAITGIITAATCVQGLMMMIWSIGY